jgi:hypothetical protein
VGFRCLDLKNKAKHCPGRAQIFDIIERAYLFMARFTWDFIRDQRGNSTLPAGRCEWGPPAVKGEKRRAFWDEEARGVESRPEIKEWGS